MIIQHTPQASECVYLFSLRSRGERSLETFALLGLPTSSQWFISWICTFYSNRSPHFNLPDTSMSVSGVCFPVSFFFFFMDSVIVQCWFNIFNDILNAINPDNCPSIHLQCGTTGMMPMCVWSCGPMTKTLDLQTLCCFSEICCIAVCVCVF